MKLTKIQDKFSKERKSVIKKFQEMYPTKEEKEKALKEMTDKDIDFLCYCSDTIHACILYSSYKKNIN